MRFTLKVESIKDLMLWFMWLLFIASPTFKRDRFYRKVTENVDKLDAKRQGKKNFNNFHDALNLLRMNIFQENKTGYVFFP